MHAHLHTHTHTHTYWLMSLCEDSVNYVRGMADLCHIVATIIQSELRLHNRTDQSECAHLVHVVCHNIIIIQAGGLTLLTTPPLLHPIQHHIARCILAHIHAIRCCKQGCERADLAYMKNPKERIKGTDNVNSTHLIMQYVVLDNLWCTRIDFIPFEACYLSNQQAKKLVSLLALSLTRPVKARNQEQNLLTTYVIMARTISSSESSRLVNCSPLLHISVHCCVRWRSHSLWPFTSSPTCLIASLTGSSSMKTNIARSWDGGGGGGFWATRKHSLTS